MLLPLMCMTVYTLLAVRVVVHADISLNEVQSTVALNLRAWGVCLRMDGTIAWEGTHVHVQRRYAKLKPRRSLWRRPQLEDLRKNKWWIAAALRSLHWGAADIYLRSGTDEAWSTALLAGAMRSLAAAFTAVMGQRMPCDVRVDADFDEPGFLLSARCIFSAVPGDIMMAVIKEAVKKTQREGFKWLSIPSRA